MKDTPVKQLMQFLEVHIKDHMIGWHTQPQIMFYDFLNKHYSDLLKEEREHLIKAWEDYNIDKYENGVQYYTKVYGPIPLWGGEK